MHRTFQRKRVLLFLIAVVLPSSVLVVLTWYIISQEQELREKRLADERRRLANEIGQALLNELEEIKLREMNSPADAARPPGKYKYASNKIVLTALTDGARLVLPWESAPGGGGSGQTLSETVFSDKIRRGEEEEFVKRQLIQANALYLECITEARQPAQEAYARLLRARVLAKMSQEAESVAEYRKVLAVSPEVTDEHGIPLCLYAASRLLERGDSGEEIAGLLGSVLEAQPWLPPVASYFLQDLVQDLVDANENSTSLKQVMKSLLLKVQSHLSRLEQAIALQEDPPSSLKARLEDPNQDTESIWVSFGNEPWLVSLTPSATGGQRMVVVTHGRSILDSVIGHGTYSDRLLENVRLTTSIDLEGEPLGTSFPGLRLVFSAEGQDSLSGYWNLQRSFYLIAVSLVICVTLFGAYFLWSDVGRELRMAEMRSQFIASVSHELKTPLTAIRMFAETLRLGRAKDPEARTEYLETIVNESHRLTRLLNNVLDFSKIEKGKRTYRKEPASLPEIAHAAARAIQYALTQEDFHLSVDVQEDMPEVLVDPDAIEQAILNLLSNAMKYSGESREIGMRVYQGDGHAVIEVTDQGIGLDPMQQDRIFEKFYRVASEQNARIPGTGLGLALVLHIVEAHGGRVELQSKPGEGSNFSIHLPWRTSDEPDSRHRG